MNITVNGKAPGFKITTLADLKRAAATPGVAIAVLSHWQPQLVGTERRPTKVQGNGYWFMAPNLKGEVVRMWADFPKAAQLAFYGDDTVTFYPNTPKAWTLRFIASGSEG